VKKAVHHGRPRGRTARRLAPEVVRAELARRRAAALEAERHAQVEKALTKLLGEPGTVTRIEL
jgi:hypothetical protein